ncbi:MAG: thiol peroxidase [Phycisphaerae bacterium]
MAQDATITMKGNPLTLVGKMPNVGDKAPDFVVVANDLKEVRLSDFAGKATLLISVPSLDTSVCSMEAHKFNQEAARMSDKFTVAVISMDMPFAQKRWCGAEHADAIKTLSDHRQASFGQAYGVLIKELRLLARAVFAIDKSGVIRHVELVREVTHEPHYDAALKAVTEAAK